MIVETRKLFASLEIKLLIFLSKLYVVLLTAKYSKSNPPLLWEIVLNFAICLGKTHTMYGSSVEAGVINMAVEQLFYAMEETPNRRFLMMVSFMEIYNETVVDLLSDPR